MSKSPRSLAPVPASGKPTYRLWVDVRADVGKERPEYVVANRQTKQRPDPAQIDTNGSRRASRIFDTTTTTVIVSGKDESLQSLDDRHDSQQEEDDATLNPTDYPMDPLNANPTKQRRRMTTVAEEQAPSTLTEDDLKAIFYGAPEFRLLVTDDTGTPQITYYDLDPDHLRETIELNPFPHPTFAAASNRHNDLGLAAILDPTTDKSYQALEIPNAISEQGFEPGSIDYEHFLQLPISDANLVDEEFDNFFNRQALIGRPEQTGLRDFNIERIIDRLSELGDLQQRQNNSDSPRPVINEQKAAEMYADLFAKLLMPPKNVPIAGQDPTGLKVQIQALVNVLEVKQLWYNFTLVEQRIRLGQLLWGVDEDAAMLSMASERDVVLLQVTLAAELLIRLEAAGPSGVAISRKIAWDLLLAKRFLHNVRIAPAINQTQENDKQQNRASLFSMLSFVTARETLDDGETIIEPVLYPRFEQRQLEGLLCFAETLQWPHSADINSKLQARIQEATEKEFGHFGAFATPTATPGSMQNNRNSYFGLSSRPTMRRNKTAQSIQLLPPAVTSPSSADAGGWLSRSWFTALVLPGEAASHFLISTLLEHSPSALAALGDTANLYGGFYYSGRSYWSKSCIVGRVLAATTGAREVMGWISTPYPSHHTEEWITIDSSPLPLRSVPASTVAAHSALFPRSRVFDLSPTDFVYPTDGPGVLGNDVVFRGLQFTASGSYELTPAPAGSVPASPTLDATPASTATCTFVSASNSRLPPLRLALRYESQFVAAWACFPRNGGHSRTGSKEVDINWGLRGEVRKDKDLPARPCHALWKEYDWIIEPVAAVLSEAERIAAYVEQYLPSSDHVKDDTDEEKVVLVLDCRGAKDLEVLGRAWCASLGVNAVVGREGRTCLGCCVREARGLDVGVVLRV
ncbi:hypothetical protein MBLNU457_3256t1 [Dothideomycetes sp. NU457]